LPLALRQGTTEDFDAIRRLREATARWLRRKGTDQWARPWPSAADQDKRIIRDLRRNKTWIVWDDPVADRDKPVAAATITLDATRRPGPVWPREKRRDKATYIRNLMVSRSYAGMRLGAELLNWAADTAIREHGAQLIRADVWTTNRALHAYYDRLGFTLTGIRDSRELPRRLAGYPSLALFERPADESDSEYSALFKVEPPPPTRWRRGWRWHRHG
jgi:RimJ/RimL family protein N-acetyltransferase